LYVTTNRKYDPNYVYLVDRKPGIVTVQCQKSVNITITIPHTWWRFYYMYTHVVDKLHCSFSSYSRIQSSSKPAPEIVCGNSNLRRDLLKQISYLSFQILSLTLRNAKFEMQKFYLVSRCGYLFYARPRSKFDLILKRIVLHNRGGKCLLRGTHCVFT